MSHHEMPTAAQFWEQDRALLAEYGPCHIETICGVAAGLRAEGKEDAAAELDRQCARMRIITMSDAELIQLHKRADDTSGAELSNLLSAEIRHRKLDI